MIKRVLLTLAAFAVLVSGCIDEKKEITLNPDGSGKMVYTSTFEPSSFSLSNEEPKDKTESQFIEGAIESSEGIDIWEDMSCVKLDNGKMKFTGTAYFRNINKIKISIDGTSFKGNDVTWSKGDYGEFTLEYGSKTKQEKMVKPQKQLTEEQVAQEVKKTQADFSKKLLPMMALLGDMKSDITVKLPGQISEIHNFTRVDDNTVSVLFEGENLVNAMSTAMQNDAWVKEIVLAGRDMVQDGPEDIEYINELMYGQKAPVSVSVNNLKDNFDYTVAVEAAKKKYNKMLEKHGIGNNIDILPANITEGASIEDIKLVGIQWVFIKSDDWNMRPFNTDSGIMFAFTGQMPYAATKALSGNLDSAVTDTGQDITRKKFGNKINFPKLSKDKNTVLFEIKLDSPEPEAAMIKKAAGTLEFMAAGDYQDIDLGFMDLAKGTKSGKMEVEIIENKPCGWKKGHTQLSVNIKKNRSTIKSVNFYDENGLKFNVDSTGTSSSGDECTFSFNMEGQWPEKAKIVINAAQKIEKQLLNFEINDLKLLDR